jgi:hypothetical protein
MKASPPSLKFWLLLGSFPFAVYALFSVLIWGAYVLAVMGEHHMRDQTVSADSPAEARAAGVFVDTVLVEPRVVQYGDYTLEFNNCWVTQLRESRRPAWYARRTVHPTNEVSIGLNYRVRYHGSQPQNPDDAPLLRCDQGYGGYYVTEAGTLWVRGEVLPPYGTYLLELPLQLTLDDGPGGLPTQQFIAYPAKQRERAHPRP